MGGNLKEEILREKIMEKKKLLEDPYYSKVVMRKGRDKTGKHYGPEGKCNETKGRLVFKYLSVLSGHRLIFVLALICTSLEMTEKK